jgi:hypothetical protein
MTTVGSVVAVHRFMSGAGADGFLLGDSSVYNWHSSPSTNKLFDPTFASYSVRAGTGWSNGVVMAPTVIPFANGLTITQVDPLTPSTGTAFNNIGADRGNAHPITLGGGYSELLIFSTALNASDRALLQTNQKSYYGTP